MTEEKRLSFSKITPGLQLGWDATSLQSAMTCPRRYQYEIVEGWRRAGSSHHLDFGTKYHAALEEFDKARCKGLSVEDALDVALEFALAETWGWDSGDTKKNRFTLIRALVWYCDEQQEEGGVQPYAFPNGTPGVELSFRLPLPIESASGEPYILCGHMDGLCTFGDENFVRERKTTDKTIGAAYFKNYQPNVQVDTYDLVAATLYEDLKISGVMIEATQAAVGFSRFHRQPIYHTPEQREEWLKEMLDVIKEAETWAVNHYWPRNTAVCGMYGGCPYRSICGMGEGKRDLWLRKSGDFVRHEWDPMQSR